MTDAMRSLESDLQQATKGGSLVLDANTLAALGTNPVAGLPGGSLALEQVAIDPGADSLSLTGRLRESWTPGGLDDAVLGELALTATFTHSAGGWQWALDFTGALQFAGHRVDVKGALGTDQRLGFNIAGAGPALPLSDLSRLATRSKLDPFTPALALLNQVTLSGLELGFGFGDKAETRLRLQATVAGGWPIVGDNLALEGISATLSGCFTRGSDGWGVMFDGSLAATISGEAGFTVTVPFNGPSDVEIIVTPADGAGSIPQLAGLLGGPSLEQTLQADLAAVRLSEVALDRVAIAFDLEARRLRYVTADAHLTLAGARLNAAVSIPGDPRGGWRFSARSADDLALPVGQLVEELADRFGDPGLPPLLSGVSISRLALELDTGTKQVAFGFDTRLALDGQVAFDAGINIAIAPAAGGYSKTLGGHLQSGGLYFGLDLKSAPGTTSFSATFDNSQNAPINLGLPGYSAPVPVSGTLGQIVTSTVPPLQPLIPSPLQQLLDEIRVSDGSIAIGDLARVDYRRLSLDYSKSGAKTDWRIGFEGGIAVTGLAELEGRLEIEIGETKRLAFVADPDSGLLPAIPVPLPQPGGDLPAVQLQLTALSFEKQATDFTLSAQVQAHWQDFTGVAAKVVPATSTATLLLSKTTKRLTVDRLADGIQVKLPAIPEPGGGELDLGPVYVNVTDLALDLGDAPALSADLAFGLPSNLNRLFGTSGGRPRVELFNTFDPRDPAGSTVKAKLSAGGGGFSVTLVSSPFKAMSLFQRAGKAWWRIDLGDFGAAEVMVPELAYTPGESGLKAAGGFEITRPLKLPLTPLKWFLNAVGLKPLADALPDGVPLQEIDILDPQGRLDPGNLRTLLGDEIPQEVGEVLHLFDEVTTQLPDRLKDYFRIVIPRSLAFAIEVDASGGVQLQLGVNKGDPPIRLLYPTLSGPFPALNGVELRSLSFGEILDGSLFVLEIDATFDQFNILAVLAAAVLPDRYLKFLPDSTKLQSTVELNKLFSVIVYETEIPIVVPLFYDRIGFDYLGVEGLQLGSHFSFPKPSLDMAEVARVLGDMSQFFTDPDYLLDPQDAPEHFDLAFTIGGNFLTLPKYVGGKGFGKRGEIARFSAYGILAHALNWCKTLDVEQLLQSFPLEYRVGNQRIGFFNLASIDVAWAVTTPGEFRTVAYQKLALDAGDADGVLAVVPQQGGDDGKGLVLLMHGGFDIAGTAAFEATFGLAGSGRRGAATGFRLQGRLADVVDADLGGLVAFLPKEKPAFQLQGKARLAVAGQRLMEGVLELSDRGLHIAGLIDLFPGVDLVEAKAQIQGDVGSGKLSLKGATRLAVGGVTVVQGSLLLSTDVFQVTGKFLALDTSLTISRADDRLALRGSTGTRLNIGVSTGPIKVLGHRVADGIDLKVDAALSLTIGVDPAGFSLEVKAGYSIQGRSLSAHARLTVVPQQIGQVSAEVAKAIAQQAEAFFQDLYEDAGAWMQGLKSGAIRLADQSAQALAGVLKDVYRQGAQETAQLLKGAQHGAEEVAGALQHVYQQSGEEAAKLLQAVGYDAAQVAGALSQAYKFTGEQAAKALKAAGFAADQVGQGLKSAYRFTGKQAAAALKAAGYAAGQVGGMLQGVYRFSADQTAKALKQAGYAVSQVGRALQQAYRFTGEQAAKALKAAGYAADQVGAALRDAYRFSANQVTRALKGAGYSVNLVAGALRSLFRCSDRQTAAALKGAGYLAHDVGKALKGVYGASANAAAKALKAAGYSANQVGGALKGVFTNSATTAAKALKAAGYSANQVGGALKGTFTNSAEAAGKALKAAGYAAQDVADMMKGVYGASAKTVAGVMKDAYGLGSDAVKGILKGANYAGSAINDVMKDIFHLIPHVKIPHIKHVKIPHVKLW